MTHGLHCHRFGTGPRPVVALHCSLAHGGAWSALAARLAGVRIIAPDLPGHGASPAWDGQGSYPDQVTRVVAALLTEIAPAGPPDLIGHSFGATVALRLALERPELVRSLVLIEPVLFAAARANQPQVFADHMARAAPFRAAFAAGDLQTAARLFHAEWGQGSPETLPARQWDGIVQRIGLVVAQDAVLTEDGAGLLGHQRLEGLGLPVLLLEGTGSPPVIGAIGRELARRLPMARRTRIDGATHMLPFTHPDAVSAAVAAHLAQT